MNNGTSQRVKGGHWLSTSVLALSLALLVSAAPSEARGRSQRVSPRQPAATQLLAQNDAAAQATASTAEADGKSEKKSFFSKVMPFGLSKPKEGEQEGADAAPKRQAENQIDNAPKAIQSAPPQKPAHKPQPTASTTTITRTVRSAGDNTGMDSALLSVLRDIGKALKDNEDVGKLEDPAQKSAMTAAMQALETALSRNEANPNRIIDDAQKERFQKALTAEAWESGNISLPNNCHASMNVLWAKKVNGLVNISITGTCSTGEFVVVINGKSALDSGFDIQSQSNVSYWIGKLTNFVVDANADMQQTSSSEIPLLHALLTEQNRNVVAVVEPAAQPSAVTTDSTNAQPVAAESPAPQPIGSINASADAPSSTPAAAEAPKIAEAPAAEKKPDAAGGVLGIAPAGGSADNIPPPPTQPTAQTGAEAKIAKALDQPGEQTTPALAPATGPGQSADQTKVAAVPTPAASPLAEPTGSTKPQNAQPPQAQLEVRAPSADAVLIAPDHAIAGDYITVCVVSKHQHKPEPQVQLVFNGQTMVTSRDGRITFQVPEDLPPGPSLLVNVSARPDAAPIAVDVLQPLLRPTGPQVPRIDRVSKVATVGSTIFIDGHNFDGLAERDHVMLDATHEAHILAASPVQIKAVVPSTLPAGQHSVLVTSNGLRSNTTPCTLVAAKLESGSRNGRRKLAATVRKHKNHRHTHVATRRRHTI